MSFHECLKCIVTYSAVGIFIRVIRERPVVVLRQAVAYRIVAIREGSSVSDSVVRACYV